jgi:hypothetical protein
METQEAGIPQRPLVWYLCHDLSCLKIFIEKRLMPVAMYCHALLYCAGIMFYCPYSKRTGAMYCHSLSHCAGRSNVLHFYSRCNTQT